PSGSWMGEEYRNILRGGCSLPAVSRWQRFSKPYLDPIHPFHPGTPFGNDPWLFRDDCDAGRTAIVVGQGSSVLFIHQDDTQWGRWDLFQILIEGHKSPSFKLVCIKDPEISVRGRDPDLPALPHSSCNPGE